MSKTTLTYKVVVAPDCQTGGKKRGYTAFVPKLGIADDGITIEEALNNVRETMQFHVDSLIKEGCRIPAPDSDEALVTNAVVDVPAKAVVNCQSA